MARILILLLAIICLCGCTKVKEGQMIIVSGYAEDTVRNERLANAKILLLGGKVTFYGPSYTDEVDSTKTDSEGNFWITYEADGKYADYALTVADGNGFFAYKVFPLNRIINQSGIKLSAQRLGLTRLHLVNLVNPYDTLYLFHFHNGKVKELIGTKLDTVIDLWNYPNYQNEISLFIRTITSDSGFISRKRVETYNPIYNDTINLVLEDLNTYDFPFF